MFGGIGKANTINLLAGNINFVDLALEILDAGTPLDLETLFAIAWSIWYNWNQVVHESSGIPSSQIWNFARCAQEDYKGAVAYSHLRQQPPDVGWAAPLSDTYKINVDGATVGARGMSSAGVVIRDSKGIIIAVGSKVLNGSYDVEVTEALVVEEGILLAKEMELHRIVVESDLVVVFEAINANNCNGDIGPIIQGTLELLRHFKSWKMRHLKRDHNRVAHDLAQVAKANGTTQQWKGREPSMIHQILLVDGTKC